MLVSNIVLIASPHVVFVKASSRTSEQWYKYCTLSRFLRLYIELFYPSKRYLFKWQLAWEPVGIFSEGCKISGTDKIGLFSVRRRRKRKFSRFLRRFRLNLRVDIASPESASENFRAFCTETAYDVIIVKFRGGGEGICDNGLHRMFFFSIKNRIENWQTWENLRL